MTPAEQDSLIAANARLRKALDEIRTIITDASGRHLPITAQVLDIASAALSEPNEQTTEGGRIEWKGGECPVADALMVRCTLRNGDAGTSRAGNLDWSHYGPGLADGDYDITAYRPVSP